MDDTGYEVAYQTSRRQIFYLTYVAEMDDDKVLSDANQVGTELFKAAESKASVYVEERALGALYLDYHKGSPKSLYNIRSTNLIPIPTPSWWWWSSIVQTFGFGE
jgi:hypothetical protein